MACSNAVILKVGFAEPLGSTKQGQAFLKANIAANLANISQDCLSKGGRSPKKIGPHDINFVK